MLKVCCKCKKEKELALFVKNNRSKSGYSHRCKSCHSIACRKYIETHPDKRKESILNYYLNNKEKCNKAAIRWAQKNKDKVKNIDAKYRSTEHAKQKAKDYRKKYGYKQLQEIRSKYPLKYKARNKVNNAIAGGKIAKASENKCYNCSNQAKEYHHHLGYEEKNWLEVLPVCKNCHAILK